MINNKIIEQVKNLSNLGCDMITIQKINYISLCVQTYNKLYTDKKREEK